MNNLTSDGANLKLYKEGTGTGQVPARVGVDLEMALITLPHGYGSSELVWQVAIIDGSGSAYFSPLAANGDFHFNAFIDDTNFYIEVADGSVVDQPAIDFTYYYRLLIP